MKGKQMNEAKIKDDGIFETTLSKPQKQYFQSLGTQMVENDISKCGRLLEDFVAGEKQIEQKLKEILEFTADPQIDFNSSINFFSSKNLIFNEYLICLKFYQLFRLSGITFTQGKGLQLYKRLLYLKTLFLKLTPMEKKIQYQKNKLLKRTQKANIQNFRTAQKENSASQQSQQEQQEENASSSNQKEEDNLIYRPRLQNLVEAEKNKPKKNPSKQKYVPVKQSQVLPSEEKQKLRVERQKQRRNAFLLKKFRGDIDEGDEAQERGILNDMDEKFKKKFEQKTRLEEQNFTRYGETKKQKFWRKQMMKKQFRGNQLNDELKEVSLIRQLVDKERTNQSRQSSSWQGRKPTKRRKLN